MKPQPATTDCAQNPKILPRLANRSPDELLPHPSYTRHQLSVTAAQLSALAGPGDFAFREPIVISRDHTIIDGYARWKLAYRQGRTVMQCLEYDLDEAEALRWLIRSHRPSNGLNAFTRILLALDLEPFFREKARLNWQIGGQNKGSSNLAEAEKVDVRAEIATLAGVSVGNVTKVKQLAHSAPAEILQALREGEISIHRAWLWHKKPPEQQRDALRRFHSEKGVLRTIRTLLRSHRSESSRIVLSLGRLVECLSALESDDPQVSVAVIKAPGTTIFLTEELYRTLGMQEEIT